MALNKSMHPRNRYKDKPPDFVYLASKYAEFQKHVQTTLTVRVTLNFKDPEAVRALTCTLLKEDFGLTIEIPLERLIPIVPLRLNYIHWVEDLTGGAGQPAEGHRHRYWWFLYSPLAGSHYEWLVLPRHRSG